MEAVINIESFYGIGIGLISFLVIGIFHPIVIKAEYHIGLACWPVLYFCCCRFL